MASLMKRNGNFHIKWYEDQKKRRQSLLAVV